MTIPENPFALASSSGRGANTQNEEIMETNRDPKTGDFMGGKEALEEQQKHEEIKHMAWEALRNKSENYIINRDTMKRAWEDAEQFYKFAKEKAHV